MNNAHILGTERIGKLLVQYSIPAIIGMTITSLYNIIDSRVKANKPMIITSNLELKDMMECHDIRKKRIYDRILECCYPMYVGGKSFRMNRAAQRFDEMKKFMEE